MKCLSQLSNFEKVSELSERPSDINSYLAVALDGKKVEIQENKQLLSGCQQFFAEQIEIYTNMTSPSILPFRGYSFTGFPDVNSFHPTLVFDYIGENNLHKVLKLAEQGDAPQEFNPTNKMKIIYGLARALYLLSVNNVVCHSLYPEKIILDEGYSPHLSYIIDYPSYYLDSMTVDHARYLAPENLKNEETSKTAVYLFGLILYSILSDCEPYSDKATVEEIKDEIAKCNKLQLPPFVNIPQGLRKILNSCLEENPNDRPTFSEIVEILDSGIELLLTDKIKYTQYRKIFWRCKPSTIGEYHELNTKLERDIHELKTPQNTNSGSNDFTPDYAKIVKGKKLPGTGDVYRGIQHSDKGDIELSLKYLKLDPKYSDLMMRELERRKRCSCPCTMEYLGSYNDENNVVIVMPFMKNNSLRYITDKLTREAIEGWNDTKKSCCAFGIAVGMAFIHQQRIIKENLTSDNIFLDENYYPHIGGTYCHEEFHQRFIADHWDIDFPPPRLIHLPPELITEQQWSTQIDVFSYSMILYEIVLGKLPFDDVPSGVLVQKICQGHRSTIPENVPQSWKDMIEKCWNQDPSMRPSFMNIVEKSRGNMVFALPETNLAEYYSYQDKIITCLNNK